MDIKSFGLTPSDVSAYERLPVPMCVIGVSGETYIALAASAGFRELLGLDAECSFSEISSCIYSNDTDDVRSMLEYAVLYGGDESHTYCRLRKKDGGYIRVFITARSVSDGNGNYLLYLTYGVPSENSPAPGTVSAKNETTEIAEAQESPIFESNGGVTILSKWHADLTANRTIKYDGFSPRALKISADDPYDVSSSYAGSRPYFEEHREKLAELLDRQYLIRRYEDGETSFSLQYRRDEDGQMPFWVSTSVNTFRSPSTGDIECFIASYDETVRILEIQLISRLSMLGYDVVGLIYVKTGKCRYFRIKKMQLGMMYEQYEDYQESIETDIDRIIAPEDKDNVLSSLYLDTIIGKLEESAIYSFSYSMTTSDGRHKQKLLQFSYLDDVKDTIFLCKSDITKQHQSEHEQIARLKEAKLEADRANEAKSSFLSSMSHDLRTPLNGIIGFTDLALREQDPIKKQNYLGKVKSSSGLLLGLVNDTLELSRIESGKSVMEYEAVNLREAACAVVNSLGPTAEIKSLALNADTADFPDVTVWTDRLKFQKVFLNLLSNAIKYTPSSGSVTASIVPIDPPEDGCNFRMIVSDTGIGMFPEFLPHIFEAFSQEHRPESANVLGTGLGLSIVKRTVDLMGGKIDVKSAPGSGSVFTVDLPLETLGNLPSQEGPCAESSVDLTGKRALICEDNQLNTEIATMLLSENGLSVTCAENGKEGAEIFRRSEPGYFSIVLMDIRMPVMDGYEATRLIRGMKRPDSAVPIIAMTADAFEEDIRSCMEAGMNGHVTKPIDPQKLICIIKENIRSD